MSNRTVAVIGTIIKIGSQFVGWDSFKSKPYLTTRNHSEIFRYAWLMSQGSASVWEFMKKHDIDCCFCKLVTVEDKS